MEKRQYSFGKILRIIIEQKSWWYAWKRERKKESENAREGEKERENARVKENERKRKRKMRERKLEIASILEHSCR